jgi:hypothetical protein
MNMSRSKAWGFPKWGDYGGDNAAVSVRLCNFDGCDDKGDFPAPKAPDSPEKWYFCQKHISDYNAKWNYFAGLNKAEAFKRAQDEARHSAGYSSSGAYENGASTYGSDERRADALEILELEENASSSEIKASYRRLAKKYHPDTNSDDLDADTKFQQVMAAYNILVVKF